MQYMETLFAVSMLYTTTIHFNFVYQISSTQDYHKKQEKLIHDFISFYKQETSYMKWKTNTA